MPRIHPMLINLIPCFAMLVRIAHSGLAVTVSELKQGIANSVHSTSSFECTFIHTANFSQPLRDGTKFTSCTVTILKKGDAVRISIERDKGGMHVRHDEAALEGVKTTLDQIEVNGQIQQSARISQGESSLWSMGSSLALSAMQFVSPLNLGYYLFNCPLSDYEFSQTEEKIEHSRVLMGYHEVYRIIFCGTEVTEGKELAVLKAVAMGDHLFYQKVLLWVDPTRGFLTIGRQYFFQPKGETREKLWKEIVVKNAEQINGVWMPTELDIINYTHGDSWAEPIFSIERVRVTSLNINEPISDERLRISLESGTRVYDEIKNKRFTIE